MASAHYADADLTVYTKVAALAQRREMCTASVETIASFVALSKSAVERALRRLGNASPDDGVVEVFTRRRTHHRSGTGRTAERWVRDLADTPHEHWVWLPVATCEALSPRLLRLYAALAYATVRRLPVTCAELGNLLGVTERTTRGLIDRLEDLGWINVHRRAGFRGRHRYEVHDRPRQPVLPALGSPEGDDGSGPDAGDGSLAYKEDPLLNDPEKTQVVRGVRHRRDTGGEAVDNPPPPRRAAGAQRRSGSAYIGPPLSLSPRVWASLEPVRDLLPGISAFLLRQAAREIGAQLDTYATPERIAARITWRRAGLDGGRPHNSGAWLLHAALPRWGCGLIACESGWLWETGRRCAICEDLAAARPPPAAAPLATPAYTPASRPEP
ncbi:hypothetical protein [Streptomyces sp. MP131-18]|uniref:hypothetical protein n=1 Tax=Streptomyces sp. MP131-18 TaxID=1857892 RepID=UPI00097C7478|nr:hypothetical protein [Streptomyces sp. MP131-18]ONK13091.1 hypothetical protein STBA_38530 [Streptomyces sp. MP131-18]